MNKEQDFLEYADAVKLFTDAGLSDSTFRRKVKEHPIRNHLPPGRQRGALYTKEDVIAALEKSRKEGPAVLVGRDENGGNVSMEKVPEKSVHATSPVEGATDWIRPSDLAYVYVLDTELYGIENSVSPTTTLTWWRKNPHACRIMFNKNNRKEIWGALSVIPMEEETIYQLLRGDLKEQDITADQVLEYQPRNKYSCYVASIEIHPEHRQSFGQLLHSVLSFWCELYPDVQITTLYGFALNEEKGTGLRLIRKLYFAPRYDLGDNAWELRLDRYNPSPIIQQFQKCLELKQIGRSAHLPSIEKEVFSQVDAIANDDLSIVAAAKYLQATNEDISALAPIDVEIFGPVPVAMEEYTAMHRSWDKQNHEVFHILKSKGRVVGYVSTIPLPLEKIMEILKEEARPRDIKPEEIDLFQPGKQLNLYIAVMGISEGFTKHQKRLLAGKLITGLTETFQTWGQRGVAIRSIYARSRFEEGITILEHIGFQEMTDISPVNDKKIFCLDLETADGPFADVYKKSWRTSGII